MPLIVDKGFLDNVRRTPSGGIIVRARTARTGLQDYGGKIAYRPAEEVFASDSLASYAGAAVTVEHPIDDSGAPRHVTADTWKRDAFGQILQATKYPETVDGEEWVATDLTIQDAQAIAYVQTQVARGGCECSMGYDIQVDATPGEYKGKRYDYVQRRIRINHVALLEPDSARAGSSARLLFDSFAHEGKTPDKQEPMPKVTIDGVSYEVGSEQHVQVLNKKLADAETANKDLQSKLEAKTKEAANAEAKAEQLEADAKAVDVDKLINDQLELRAQATKVLGKDYSFKGKSARQIKVDALKKMGKSLDDKASDLEVDAHFEARISTAKGDDTDYNKLQNDSNSSSTSTVDARQKARDTYAAKFWTVS